MATLAVPHEHNQRVFDEASSYYQNLRWFKTRLTRFEYSLTRKVLLEEIERAPHGNALEIGCGPGTWTREVAPFVRHLTAVDISGEMIAQAKRYVRASHVDYVQSDAAQLPIDKQYDLVFSVRVIEYLEDWRPVIDRLLQSLAPGGRLVIITKTPKSVWRGTGRELAVGQFARKLRRRVLGKPEPEKAPFWQRYVDPNALAGTYEAQGLEQVRVRPVIYGLPIFVRGTQQYPIVPRQLEPLALAAFAAGWKVADSLPDPIRPLGLTLSESFAVTGRRPYRRKGYA